MRIATHDAVPGPEGSVVDGGLGAFNDEAAPLHEVQPLSCFAHDDDGRVVGGAVGRTWGACAEIQQLWVASESRGRGLGTQLMQAFEARARDRGCRSFFLETFSFQAPAFYRRQGWRVVFERGGYPHGIVKYTMLKGDPPGG